MGIKYSHGTHVGLARSHNEDAYYICDKEPFFCVADGMGGHSSGDVASKLAVDTVHEFLDATRDDEEATWPFKLDKKRNYDENRIITSIKLANLRIYEKAQQEEKLRGMGTTMASVFFKNADTYIAHVGDSRVYRIHAAGIEQLTEDHSLLNDYIKHNKVSQEEIENFQYKNVIVRALGMKEMVEVDIQRVAPRDKDLFLLCSDGLSSMVTDPEIFKICGTGDDLDLMVNKLIEKANAAGGLDNITVLLTQYLEK